MELTCGATIWAKWPKLNQITKSFWGQNSGGDMGQAKFSGSWEGGGITPETLSMHHALFPAKTITTSFDVKGNLQHCKGICSSKNLYSLSSLFSREE